MARGPIFAAIKLQRNSQGFAADEVSAVDAVLDRLGIPRDTAPPALATPVTGPGTARLTIGALQRRIGTPETGTWSGADKAALSAKLSNKNAPALTPADFERVAAELGAPIAIMRGVRKVEAPRGAFDDLGRPSILYERHVANRNTMPQGAFAARAPAYFGGPYGRGGYGSFDSQYDKLFAACAFDPEAAFRACSWGAFQVLGENAVALGYASAFDMALALTVSEAAQLDSFARYVRVNHLEDELRACVPGNPASCIPFVKGYNGSGYAEFGYHIKLATESK